MRTKERQKEGIFQHLENQALLRLEFKRFSSCLIKLFDIALLGIALMLLRGLKTLKTLNDLSRTDPIGNASINLNS